MRIREVITGKLSAQCLAPLKGAMNGAGVIVFLHFGLVSLVLQLVQAAKHPEATVSFSES